MSDKFVDNYAARRQANAESRSWATRDREPWTEDEKDFLVEFWIDLDPSERDEVTVSKCLERTIESCRVQCEKIRKERGWSRVTFKQTTTEITYIGSADPDDEPRWWDPSYYTQGS